MSFSISPFGIWARIFYPGLQFFDSTITMLREWGIKEVEEYFGFQFFTDWSFEPLQSQCWFHSEEGIRRWGPCYPIFYDFDHRGCASLHCCHPKANPTSWICLMWDVIGISVLFFGHVLFEGSISLHQCEGSVSLHQCLDSISWCGIGQFLFWVVCRSLNDINNDSNGTGCAKSSSRWLFCNACRSELPHRVGSQTTASTAAMAGSVFMSR